eukprot:m.52202 g.52202  ORF g.52202 m.52202 type:complete len:104 (-) comp48412_c1_seq4:179-490(-)
MTDRSELKTKSVSNMNRRASSNVVLELHLGTRLQQKRDECRVAAFGCKHQRSLAIACLRVDFISAGSNEFAEAFDVVELYGPMMKSCPTHLVSQRGIRSVCKE